MLILRLLIMQEHLLYQVDGQVIDNRQDLQVLRVMLVLQVLKELKGSKELRDLRALKVHKVTQELKVT